VKHPIKGYPNASDRPMYVGPNADSVQQWKPKNRSDEFDEAASTNFAKENVDALADVLRSAVSSIENSGR
jgi:hypothetical protein